MAKFKWTVEFTVDETWVADGFDLTDERAHAMLNADLSLARSHEIKARVIKAPTALEIAKAQGYENLVSGAQEIAAKRSAEKRPA